MVPLVLLIFFAVVQIALLTFTRTTLIACAAEGARAGAASGNSLVAAERHTRQALDVSLVGDVVASIDSRVGRRAGITTIAVDIQARLPLVGLFGPTTQTVTAHSLAEAY